MRVLLLAPHPFYQERGTPIAVDLLVRALIERGDRVDLLTFHEGEDRSYDGLRIVRISRPPFIASGIRPGYSNRKLVCDVWLFWKMIRLLRRNDYDVIHAVEESAFMAMLAAPLFSLPFVYDIDSSMTTQLMDRFRILRLLERPLRYLESLPVRTAAAVVPMCDALAEDVAQFRPAYLKVLRDVSIINDGADTRGVTRLREHLGISGGIAMYIGNLEPYQGIDLLLESFTRVLRENGEARLVIIGGSDSDISRYRSKADALGLAGAVHLIGRRPVDHLAAYMRQADVLVSPRVQGANTPMKVYSYLHSGVAVLATALPTHTQAMNSNIARLVAPDPDAFGAALLELLYNRELRGRLGARAHEHVEREHSYAAFRRTVHELYSHLESSFSVRVRSRGG